MSFIGCVYRNVSRICISLHEKRNGENFIEMHSKWVGVVNSIALYILWRTTVNKSQLATCGLRLAGDVRPEDQTIQTIMNISSCVFEYIKMVRSIARCTTVATGQKGTTLHVDSTADDSSARLALNSIPTNKLTNLHFSAFGVFGWSQCVQSKCGYYVCANGFYFR